MQEVYHGIGIDWMVKRAFLNYKSTIRILDVAYDVKHYTFHRGLLYFLAFSMRSMDIIILTLVFLLRIFSVNIGYLANNMTKIVVLL